MKKTLLVLGFASLVSFAETSGTATTSVAAPTASSKLYGTIELRPSVNAVTTTKNGTENTIEVGAKIGDNTKFNFTQYFGTNLGSFDKGLGLVSQGTYVGAKFSKVLENKETGWSMDINPRVYLPTDPDQVALGFVTRSRTFFDFNKKFSNFFSLTLTEAPNFYVYNKGGAVDGKGNPVANYWFQNEILVDLKFQLAKKLSLEIPIRYSLFAHRDNGSSELSYGVSNKIDIYYAELDYDFTSNFTMGLGYYSGNLFKYSTVGAYQGLDAAAGLADGTAALVLRATL